MISPRLDEHAVISGLSSHDTAVLLHSSAIEKTLRIQKNKASADQPLDEQTIQEWQGALKAWYDVWIDNEYWQGVEKRATELGKTDRRLKATDATEIHDGLPMAILGINAKLAAEDLRLNCTKRAAQHLRLGLSSGFPFDKIQEAYSHLFDPLKDKIKENLVDVQTRVTKDETMARQLYTELGDKVQPLFNQIAMVDPTGLLSIDTTKDDYSNAIRSLAISHVNKTNDAITGSLMIQVAIDVAVSTSVRKRLEEDLLAIRKMLTQGFEVPGNYDPSKCWFCGNQPSESQASKVVWMHKIIERTYQGIRYRDLDLKIPRCNHCLTQHKAVGKAQGLGVVLYFLIAIILSATVSIDIILIAIFIPPAWIVAYIFYRTIRYINVNSYCKLHNVKKAKGEGKYKECPLLQAAQTDGYLFGKFNREQNR
jgi:hypothetical protein